MRDLHLCILTCLFIFQFTLSHGQDSEQFAKLEEEMSFYGDVMVNALNSKHRIRAHTEFHTLFKQALEMDGSQLYPFDSLIWISRLYAPDSTLRIFSWQVKHNENKHAYHAFVQHLNQEVEIVELEDVRPLSNGSEFSLYDNQTWYGALYYGIHQFDLSDDRAFLLLGFDAHNASTNRKIADILIVEDNGKLTFGADLFVSKDEQGNRETKKRIIIEYSDGIPAHMRYDDDLNMLMYDHLITTVSGGEFVAVPDGSYEAYAYDGQHWNYVEKVFDQISEEPPVPFPASNEKKDLFGRAKKN